MTRKQERLAEAEERLNSVWSRIDVIRDMRSGGSFADGIDAALRVVEDMMTEITTEMLRSE